MPYILDLYVDSRQNIGFGWPLLVMGYVVHPTSAPVVTITPVSVNTDAARFETTLLQPEYAPDVYIFYLYIKSTESLAAQWHFPSGRYTKEVTHTLRIEIPRHFGPVTGKSSVPFTTILDDPPLGRPARFPAHHFAIDGPKTITSFPVKLKILGGPGAGIRVGLISWSKSQAGRETPQGWGVLPSLPKVEPGPGSGEITVKEHLGNGPHILQAYFEVPEEIIVAHGPVGPVIKPAIYCSRPFEVEVNAPEPSPSKPPPTPTPPPTPSLSQMLTPLMAIAFLSLIPALLKPKKRAT